MVVNMGHLSQVNHTENILKALCLWGGVLGGLRTRGMTQRPITIFMSTWTLYRPKRSLLAVVVFGGR
jgi:hypothetical protein